MIVARWYWCEWGMESVTVQRVLEFRRRLVRRLEKNQHQVDGVERLSRVMGV
jgi:hypothetical protein